MIAFFARLAPAIGGVAVPMIASLVVFVIIYHLRTENDRLQAELDALKATVKAEEMRREADDRAASDPDPVGRLQREYGTTR